MILKFRAANVKRKTGKTVVVGEFRENCSIIGPLSIKRVFNEKSLSKQ